MKTNLRYNSRKPHLLPLRDAGRAFIFLCLLMASVGAWATDYVFNYGGNYLGVDANGTLTNYNTFEPAFCVWTCDGDLGTTSRSLYVTRGSNNTKYYLYTNQDAGNAVDVQTSEWANWRLNDNRLAYHWASGNWWNQTNNYAYLYYRGDSWRTSNQGQGRGNTYYIANNGNTDYRATLTTSTTTTARDNTTLPTVSCSSGSAGLQMSHTALGGTYTPAATTIVVGGTTYYKGTNGVYSTTAPSATLNPQYAWSINSGNASITDAGVLTLTSNQSQNVTVRLTITNTTPAITKTVDYNLSATRTDALNETAYGDITITPSSQTLDLGESVTYTVASSISQVTKTRPRYVTITDEQGHKHYKVDNTYQATEPTITETPGAAINFTSFNWSAAEGGAYFTLEPYYSASSNQVTLTRSAQKTGTQQTFTISVTGQYGSQSKTASATVTIPATQVDLTALHAGEAINLGMGSSEGISSHYTYEPDYDAAGSPYLKFKYTSANTSVATVDASGKVTAVGPGSTTITVTAVKLDGTDGVTCDVTVNVAIDAPTISIDGSGNVSITHPVQSVQIRYTTDGTDPTATTGTVYTASFTAGNEQTIKAIAVANGVASAVASQFYVTSGVSGGKVVLDDYEDHTWTYYAGVDPEVDGGNYNTNYKGKLYSPNPRNVKITYKANGGAVSIDESETEFVYYKTLEESATAGEYQYQVISNPFSKRPNGKGFGGWQITKGADYIKNKNANATLALDEEIVFENLPYPSVNCTSAEIELTATWVNANIQYGGSNINATAFRNGNYETNILVINANYTNALAPTYPVTIMMVEPDGSADYRGRTLSSSITPVTGAANTTKIEFANWTNTGDINAQGRNLTIGRGVTHSGGTLYGTNTNANINQVFKIESGTYTNFYAIGDTGPDNNMTKQYITFGNDYDRANNNDNSKMRINNGMYLLGKGANTGTDKLIITAKSGSFTPLLTHTTASASGNCFYLSYNSGTQRTNHRTLIIEGGEFWHIAGGYDRYATNDVNLKIRVKGGIIHGCVYGGAAKYRAQGSKQFVFTGGTVEGWIAGGSNGFGATTNTGATSTSTSSVSGDVQGQSYIYVGGNTIVKSNNETKIDESVGGNVFGAGCGNTSIESSGRVNRGTNVVIADNAEVQRGVYGGGAYGSTPATANMYVTGGLVSSIYDTQNNAFGGVYGGARQKSGADVNIYMTDGTIEGVTRNGNTGGGLYGGSNNDGTLSGSVKMQINGGYVGTESHVANIHGGGYGQTTGVSGNVDINLGKTGAARDADGVTVWGDVYGGSALGSVNGTAATNTYNTNVTMNAGYIHGSLYGGALGSNTVAANVYGPVAVTVNGGSVFNTDGTGANGSGAVYGANNINGAPQRSVTVDIYGTNSAPAEGEYALFSVYGGGNQANYTYGNGYPKVTVHNCDNSIEYVYGGGNAAAVAATDVTIYGGNKIGNVFGGGNGQVKAANVTGGTNVKIYGGTIGDVYGGSNTNGTIGGTISVNVNAQAEGGHDACPVNIDNVYGGGNKAASAAGNVTIGCAEHIGAVYGGANQANINGNINLSIVSGHIDNVFGGNNTSGNISGTITVTVNDNNSACGMLVGNVFGAGNLATYTGSPVVNIKNGTVTSNVYGGGKGDPDDHTKGQVTGNPIVTIGDMSEPGNEATVGGDVYGGGDAGNVVGTPQVRVPAKTNTTITNVYGGGNAADVSGTDLLIDGGHITGMVFGGGHGSKDDPDTPETDPVAANVNGNVQLYVTGGTINKVFAGSNANGNITGSVDFQIAKGNTSNEMHISEVYGGGNEAAGNAGTILIGCTGGDSEGIGDVYGGANAADINSNITLTIKGGRINNVFGGNNTSGDIDGDIEVNVEWNGGCTNSRIGNVYGGGNLAQYSGSPVVNIKNGTISQNVYGGGKGDPADHTKGQITGAPVVNIGDNTDAGWVAHVVGDVYGGGDAGNVVGTPQVNIINKCNTIIDRDVYGGGNAADVSSTDVNIDGGTITGMVFGGGHGDLTSEPQKEANVGGDVHVDITGGTIGKVFGGSNSKGNITGTINLNINKEDGHCDMHITEVYGGGNLAAGASGNITIGCTGGDSEGIGDVYGGANAADINNAINLTIKGGRINRVFGGNNASGSITGPITVNVDWDDELTCGKYLGDVFGGGNLANYANATEVNMKKGTVNHIYGGGNEAGVGSATVNMQGGDVLQGLYGGCNTSGTVTGDIAVNVTGGQVGTDADHKANVHGGGYGSATGSNGNVGVAVSGGVLFGDVYGGSALGNVNGTSADASKHTNVSVSGGTINGNVYGGGLGSKSPLTEAKEYGTVNVTIDPGANITGDVFGCNNAAGAPQGAVNVVVNGTSALQIHNVYGGGNEAAYSGTPSLTVNGCLAVINDLYGGGNAAATGGTSAVVNGGTIARAFGGGNGESGTAADVNGNSSLTIHGGTISQVFGGSNSNGTVSGTMALNIDHTSACEENITDVYGGGNMAPGKVAELTIGCGAGPFVNVFGGSNNANVSGNIVLNITGGTITNVFGGNNTGGTIDGTVTVNVSGGHLTNVFGENNDGGNVNGKVTVNIEQNDLEDCEHLTLDYVYGGGKNAAYTPTTPGAYPEVNLIKGVVNHDVFGGGLGSGATVTSNPTVTMRPTEKANFTVKGNIYGGGSAARVNGSTSLTISNGTIGTMGSTSPEGGYVFGGGLGQTAVVSGNTRVQVKGSTDVEKNVYGGGNGGEVEGNTKVIIGE